jgi:Domain of unknown function (DUF4826)
MNPDDEYDEAAEEAWVAEQRSRVADYLREQGVSHGEIGEWPAWHVQPCVAILAIESSVAPGRMGWWTITGDCPTDYVSFSDSTDHPRKAMQHFACQWAEVSSYMLRGEPHPETIIGTPDQWPELGELLKRRSELLAQFADDDSLWE